MALLASVGSVQLSAADDLPALKVQGNQLVDENGKTIVLHGVPSPRGSMLDKNASSASSGYWYYKDNSGNYVTGDADNSNFSETLFKKYLESLYVPVIKQPSRKKCYAK